MLARRSRIPYLDAIRFYRLDEPATGDLTNDGVPGFDPGVGQHDVARRVAAD